MFSLFFKVFKCTCVCSLALGNGFDWAYKDTKPGTRQE